MAAVVEAAKGDEGFKPLSRMTSAPAGYTPQGKSSNSSDPVSISCEFDSGNIECLDATDPTGAGIQLAIRPDVFTELEKKAHMQASRRGVFLFTRRQDVGGAQSHQRRTGVTPPLGLL
jgi:hypothetical protein